IKSCGQRSLQTRILPQRVSDCQQRHLSLDPIALPAEHSIPQRSIESTLMRYAGDQFVRPETVSQIHRFRKPHRPVVDSGEPSRLNTDLTNVLGGVLEELECNSKQTDWSLSSNDVVGRICRFY